MPTVSFTAGEVRALRSAINSRETELIDAMADEETTIASATDPDVEYPAQPEAVRAAMIDLSDLADEAHALQRAAQKLARTVLR